MIKALKQRDEMSQADILKQVLSKSKKSYHQVIEKNSLKKEVLTPQTPILKLASK